MGAPMELKHILIFLIVIFRVTSAFEKFSTENFSRLLAETKVELAKSLFRRDLKEKESRKIVSVNYSSTEELKFLKENGRIFRNADGNFLFDGDVQLQKNDTSENRYILNPVDDVRLEEGAVFFKNAEWKNKTFLVVCYQAGYCEVRMSAPSLKVNLKFKINTETLPLDVIFFGTDHDLFLIVVQDPVTTYRWAGTYFNEDFHLDTTGARSVAAFQDGDKSIIIVAQNLGRNKVYSKVYIHKNDKIELFQLLPTNQALRVLPFELTHGSEVLHFAFVLNNVPPSVIFWWTGKEFVVWKYLEFGSRIVYIGKIQSELFFFVSDKNKIYVYHPTVTSFDLMQIITFDQEVVGIDLRHKKDQMPMLVVLTGSALDPYFKVNLILLQINYLSDLDREDKNPGGLLQCLLDLREKLNGRKAALDKIYKKFAENNTLNANNLEQTPVVDTLREVSQKVEQMQERLEAMRNETTASQSRKYHVYGDLRIGQMTADRIDVEILNGEKYDFGNLLSLTKDQILKNKVELRTLLTEVLRTPSVNGIATEDLLVRNKEVQNITGEYTLASLTARSIKFDKSAKLNKLSFSDLLTSRNSEDLITGKKTIPKLKVKLLEVDSINNVPSEEWLAKILPTLKNQNEEESLNFTELSIEKLWVSNLNGIPWDDFVDSVYLPLNNEGIKGNIRATGTVKTKELKTKKINGIPIEEIQSKSSHPNTTCRKKPPKKPKSLPLELSSVWDESFLKDVLNEPGYEFDDEVKHFTGTQKVDGDLRVSHVFLRNPSELSGFTIDNPENFKTKYWMKSQDQVIHVPVEFTNEIFVTNSMLTNKINNRSLNSFIWTDRFNSVPASLTFEDVVIIGDVTLSEDAIQNTNVKKINQTAVKTTGENVISGRKTFLRSLEAKNLYMDVLNGAEVTDFSSLIKKTWNDSDNVEVSELVIFGDLEVKNGIQVKRINDADFNETISKALTWDDPNLFRKVLFRSLAVKNLEVNTINGLNVEDKLPKLSKTQNNDVYVVIEGNFELPELNTTKVNGINFNKYINQVFQINETQTIRGEKIFKEMVTVTGDLRGNLNEYNITELEKTALSKSKFQLIIGLYMVEEFQANDVEVENFDGVPMDQILYQDSTSTQIINSDIVFNNMAVAGDIKALNFMNDCNLSKVTEVNVENMTDFETLEVKGDISWETHQEKIKGLSYFLTNAVTKSGDQVITGPVVFENDVVMKNVNGKRHFNDVDLKFISEDAIYQSVEEQEISTPVTFKGAVKVNNIQILGKVLIDSINGVDITDLEDRLVRKSADVVVKGKKIFERGFSANYFVSETVNGVKIDQIIFYDDLAEGKEIRLPSTIFKKLNVFNDLKVLRINGYPFDQIIDQRLSKTGDQVVSGKIVVEGNVIIKGDGNIQRINDVSAEEAILADGEVSAKVITGDIEFRDTISIADKLEVDYINGHNITALLEKALMVDDDAVIEGDVEFASNITVQGNIDVKTTVNSCDLKKVIHMDFTDGSNETNHDIRNSLREEVEELTNLTATMGRPIIFMYLKEIAKLDLQLPTIHGSVANKYNNSVEFNIYGMNYGNCGLPAECYCPTQTNLKIQSLKPTSIEVEANSSRFFSFHDESLKVEVKVSTSTVSYSSRCKRRDDGINQESTSIFWRKMEEDDDGKVYEPKIVTGFLSDVKFFRLGDSIYVVMAFYFHPAQNVNQKPTKVSLWSSEDAPLKVDFYLRDSGDSAFLPSQLLLTETNNLHTIVYELKVHEEKIEKVDEIPSSGAQVLEVFWTMKGVILVIGNSFDSDRYTDSVNSAIYRFNEFENKFEFLRFVKTHGVLAIKSMRYKKTSFIFFVQKQTWPLLILKYNHEYDNYYFSQKLDTAHSLVRSNFLSVSVISTTTPGYSGDLFVGIVLSDNSFRLFKYKHIEGFVEKSYQEQNNIRILHPFWIGSTQYLLAGSGSDTSKIYALVEQGR